MAVIGAGISGLTAAHRLADDFDVTVFEGEGASAATAARSYVETDDGAQPVDTGFIVFNDRNYPNFNELLDEIGAEHVPSNMSFSVSDERGDFEYAGSSPNALYATRRNIVDPRFHRMVADLVRFNREAKKFVRCRRPTTTSRCASTSTLGGYSQYFVERLIVPQVSAVWSADPAQLYEFPARIVFQFFDNHGILELTGRPQWRTIKGGSNEYVKTPDAQLRRRDRDRRRRRGDPARRERRGDQAQRRRRGDLRRSRDRDALRPGAGDAGRPDRRRARGARRDSLRRQRRRPAHRRRRCCPSAAPRGRAGTSTCSTSRATARPSPTG